MKLQKLLIFLILILMCFSQQVGSQDEQIQWISFEELDEKLDQGPKKVLIYFHTSWCTYCRKMEKEVFTNPEVVKLINQQYLAVKFDAESTEEVTFEGVIFRNANPQNSFNRGVHEFTELLAMHQGQFTPPVFLVLDEKFKVIQRKFEYMSGKELLRLLN
jgi:thioredoxin-related protein